MDYVRKLLYSESFTRKSQLATFLTHARITMNQFNLDFPSEVYHFHETLKKAAIEKFEITHEINDSQFETRIHDFYHQLAYKLQQDLKKGRDHRKTTRLLGESLHSIRPLFYNKKYATLKKLNHFTVTRDLLENAMEELEEIYNPL